MNCFLITTYKRAESCQRLVDALQGQGEIVVYGDNVDYTIERCTFHNRSVHYGRHGYFQTVNDLFNRRYKADYYFMLPDDFMPKPDMVERAIEIWNSIDDPQKICLNLFADRIGIPCWSRFTPIDKGNVWHTQWVDMCFMSTEYFFVMLGRLRRSISARGSGVGQYVSLTLKNKKFNMYQVKESLVIPMEEHDKSQMHDENNMPYRHRSSPVRKSKRLYRKPL